mgnify:CR=1 FL=1
MKPLTCIVIGGGYAGIHAVKTIRKTFHKKAGRRPVRIVLIDRNLYHLRKVLLFRLAAKDEDITVPLAKLFPEGVELVQATVTGIDMEERKLVCEHAEGRNLVINYDIAVVAAGSVVRQPDPAQGGIALTDPDAARKIRDAWRTNLKKAALETSGEERRRMMTIAVGGAGISGIETAAELAHFVRDDAQQLGLDPGDARIILFNSQSRLFPQGPAKVGRKLEHALQEKGVTVIHGSRVLREKGGMLTLTGGETMPAGLLIWTLGLKPNPMLRDIGLPVNAEGYVIVDASYRVQGARGLYAIGDCAHVTDSATGRADGKTCKEAAAQAIRLGRIIAADLAGRPAPLHNGYIDFFCFGLGPEQGMAWVRKWGIDIVFAGKLGWRMRKLTWDIASLL